MQVSTLPIFVINLFLTHGGIPRNLTEVKGRMMEIAYENRFWAHYEDPKAGLAPFTDMLEGLDHDLPKGSPIRSTEPFRRLRRLRALKNLNVISAEHTGMAGGADFSAYGVEQRFNIGYQAVDHYFAEQPSGTKVQPRAMMTSSTVARI